ncbi:MAG: PQQ-binding-like beta-propeller repeat protein [Bacteroidota bacterium]
MKRYIIRSFSVILIFTSSSIPVVAGNLWTKDMKSPIVWQKVTSLGQIIAATQRGLIGVDPGTGEELWLAADVVDAPESSYESIRNSPFISLSTDGGKNFCIMDPDNGKVVFNAKSVGLEAVSDKYFLYSSGKILVIGTSAGGKNSEMVMVEMATGKKLWTKSGSFTFVTAVKDLGKDEVLVLSAFFAAKLNAATGSEIWKKPITPAAAKMTGFMASLESLVANNVTKEELMTQLITTPYFPGCFIMAGQSKKVTIKSDASGKQTSVNTYSAIFMAFDIASGDYKWADVVNMNYPLGISYPCADGLIISSSAGGNLNMLSYSDGSGKLGKKGNGLNLKGPASGAVQLKDGRLLIVSNNGDNSVLTALDTKTGQFTFEKVAKIDGIVSYTELLPNGVLVGTSEEVNYLNTSTGEWYFEDAVPGGAGCIDSDDNSVYVFNAKSGILMKMAMNGTSLLPLNTVPVEFKGKERAGGLDLLKEGVVVKSDQNLALIGYDGSVKFNKYFEAPGVSGLRKALLIASAVRAAYYSAAFATYSVAFGSAAQQIEVKDPASKAGKDLAAGLSQGFGEVSVTAAGYASDFIKRAGQRFKATTETPNYNLIMSTGDKGTANLLQVSKISGDVLLTIPLGKDKNPVYDVDMVEGKLYYMKDADTMECHVF